MTRERRPYWDTERELWPEPEPETCELCGSREPLFQGHSPRDGSPLLRCEDMVACRQRYERMPAETTR
jgi:hypothetical protein